MSAFIEKTVAGFRVCGRVDFDSACTLENEGKEHIEKWKTNSLQIDFTQVEYSNNSGLALLTGWLRFGKTLGKTLHFNNLPLSLIHMAQVCGIKALLPLTENH